MCRSLGINSAMLWDTSGYAPPEHRRLDRPITHTLWHQASDLKASADARTFVAQCHGRILATQSAKSSVAGGSSRRRSEALDKVAAKH